MFQKQPPSVSYFFIYLSIYLHFPSRKIKTKKQTNKITRSPDTNIPESTWEYKITNNNNINNNNIYIYI